MTAMQRQFRSLTTVLFALAFALTPGALGAANVALLIGNNDYRELPRLANPVNDARLVAESLQSIGFAVTVATNLDSERMEAALDSFSEQSAGADIAILFFAGHGLQLEGENFLLPIDVRRSNHVLSHGSLSAVLDRMGGAANRVVLLDACRDNALDAVTAPRVAGARNVTTGPLSRGLIPVDLTGGQAVPTLISFATAPGGVAADGEGETNSPYSKALARQLTNRGVEIRDLLDRVTRDVLEASNGAQRPWVNASLTRSVYLYPADTGELDIRIRRPENALIYINDVLVDRGSAVVGDLPPGKVAVRIEAPGYVSQSTELTVYAGESEVFTTSLRRDTRGGANVLESLNEGRPWCCDASGKRMCLMPGSYADAPTRGCLCPGRNEPGQLCS